MTERLNLQPRNTEQLYRRGRKGRRGGQYAEEEITHSQHGRIKTKTKH